MIDLHLHTTASDGRLTPAELVARVAAAGLTVIAVTDHDTIGAVDETTALAAGHAIRVIPGVELTAVDEGRDVHLLAYFVPHHDPGFEAFLTRQRERRVERVQAIGERLARAGVPLDVEALLNEARERPGTSVGRPWIARALVRSGHASSVADAFERLLSTGQPGFVPRQGPSPPEVVARVHALGGIVSFAHPAVTRRDDLIEPLVSEGLDAIEVYHSDHSPDVRARYRALADALGVAVSGGSDFHGTGETRAVLGRVWLPAADFARLEARRQRPVSDRA